MSWNLLFIEPWWQIHKYGNTYTQLKLHKYTIYKIHIYKYTITIAQIQNYNCRNTQLHFTNTTLQLHKYNNKCRIYNWVEACCLKIELLVANTQIHNLRKYTITIAQIHNYISQMHKYRSKCRIYKWVEAFCL